MTAEEQLMHEMETSDEEDIRRSTVKKNDKPTWQDLSAGHSLSIIDAIAEAFGSTEEVSVSSVASVIGLDEEQQKNIYLQQQRRLIDARHEDVKIRRLRKEVSKRLLGTGFHSAGHISQPAYHKLVEKCLFKNLAQPSQYISTRRELAVARSFATSHQLPSNIIGEWSELGQGFVVDSQIFERTTQSPGLEERRLAAKGPLLLGAASVPLEQNLAIRETRSRASAEYFASPSWEDQIEQKPGPAHANRINISSPTDRLETEPNVLVSGSKPRSRSTKTRTLVNSSRQPATKRRKRATNATQDSEEPVSQVSYQHEEQTATGQSEHPRRQTPPLPSPSRSVSTETNTRSFRPSATPTIRLRLTLKPQKLEELGELVTPTPAPVAQKKVPRQRAIGSRRGRTQMGSESASLVDASNTSILKSPAGLKQLTLPNFDSGLGETSVQSPNLFLDEQSAVKPTIKRRRRKAPVTRNPSGEKEQPMSASTAQNHMSHSNQLRRDEMPSIIKERLPLPKNASNEARDTTVSTLIPVTPLGLNAAAAAAAGKNLKADKPPTSRGRKRKVDTMTTENKQHDGTASKPATYSRTR